MTSLWYLFLALLPAFVQRPLRNMAGARIERGAHVSWLAFVAVRDLRMERGARIGPLTVVKGVRALSLGAGARIDPMVLVNCRPGPDAALTVGRRSRVMSFSVLEPSEGITIGDETGLGGQCLIFCHGSWPNYLEGAPFARGPVRIGNEVWIPWRVMILPNAEIPDRSVVGAHSLVRGRLERPGALYSGLPAKLVVEEMWSDPDRPEQLRRLTEIFQAFAAREPAAPRMLDAAQAASTSSDVAGAIVYAFGDELSEDTGRTLARNGANVFDFGSRSAYVADALGRRFVGHLETYGVRVDTDA